MGIKVIIKIQVCFLCINLFFISEVVPQQIPETLWINNIGGENDEVCTSSTQTTDNGFIFAGYTSSYGAGGYDVYLVKTDSNGDTLWTRTYGGIGNDYGNSVLQTSDNGFLVVGSTHSFGSGGSDVYVIKTNSTGDTTWTRTFGGGNNDIGHSVILTDDGGFVIAGDTQSYGNGNWDVYVLRNNSDGDTLWTTTYGTSDSRNPENGVSVTISSDGGYVIVGNIDTFGAFNPDIYLGKIDQNGNLVWTRQLNFIQTYYDYAKSIITTPDNGFAIIGEIGHPQSTPGSTNILLVKTNSEGNTLWFKTFGGTSYESGFSVDYSDSSYILCGYSESYGAGDKDVYLIETDNQGTVKFDTTFGGSNEEIARHVQNTSDGGYIISGSTASYVNKGKDYYVIRLKGKSPSPPQNLNASPNYQKVTLTWDRNSEEDLNMYKIYRSLNSNIFTLIDSVQNSPPTDSFFVDEGLLNGQSYYYKITAVNNEGYESDYSNIVSAIPLHYIEACGYISQNTIWDADTVKILCDVIIEDGITLTIRSGTYVEFQGYYFINIQGRLLAVGTAGDTITFTAKNINEGWHGLRFDNTASGNDSSKIVFCKLQYSAAKGEGDDANGGAIFIKNYSKINIDHCKISNNTIVPFGKGGGIYCENSNLHITNSMISNNHVIPLNQVSSGGGMYWENSNIQLEDCIFVNNNAYYGGGLWGDNSAFKNCSFRNNSAGESGGGFQGNYNVIEKCVIGNNTVQGQGNGGGVYGVGNMFINCLINNNHCGYLGGGVRGDNTEFQNCSIVYNYTTQAEYGKGGGFYGSNGKITNTILWANSANNGNQIFGSNQDVTYSDVQGGWSGMGNIDADPLFADPGTDDYHLTWADFPISNATKSPCIDTGDPNSPLDPDGTITDMGAFYFDQGANAPPSSPQNLMSESGDQKVMLHWNQNTEPDLHKYNIYRDTSSPATTLVDSVVAASPPDTFYVDSELVNEQTCYYRVTAVDSAGNESGFSNEVSATPLSEWQATISVTNIESQSNPQTAALGVIPLLFGGSPAATDGFDVGLDIAAPPPPLNYFAFFSISEFPNQLNKDIRAWLPHYKDEILWTLQIVNANGLTSDLSWDPSELPPQGHFFLEYNGGEVNMRRQNSVALPNAGNQTVNIHYMYDVCVTYDFPVAEGAWYLISLPVIPEDNSLATLFPGAIVAYDWNFDGRQYDSVDSLDTERAHWLLFLDQRTAEVCGQPVYSYSNNYNDQGWDMIGSVMDTSLVEDNPPGSILDMYGWDVNEQQYTRLANPFEVDFKQGYWALIFGVPSSFTIGINGIGESIATTPYNENDITSFYKQFGTLPPAPPKFEVSSTFLEPSIPQYYSLSQNYPNPFNPETVIEFQLPQAGKVSLKVYSVRGQEVRTLVEEDKPAGVHHVILDSMDDSGRKLASGLYLYRIQVGDFVQTRKALFLK